MFNYDGLLCNASGLNRKFYYFGLPHLRCALILLRGTLFNRAMRFLLLADFDNALFPCFCYFIKWPFFPCSMFIIFAIYRICLDYTLLIFFDLTEISLAPFYELVLLLELLWSHSLTSFEFVYGMYCMVYILVNLLFYLFNYIKS
jgi:hypothetical protein